MSRRVLMFCLILALPSVPLRAQAPTAPALPSTAAGSALRAWLEAYNSGDSAQMAAYLSNYQPERRSATRCTSEG
ncbi:MAG: hypothetical protein ACR2NS_01975 [Gemmatimonadaceae bacterium]